MDSKGHRSRQSWPGHGLSGAGIAVTALAIVIAITLASEVAVVSAAPPGGNYYNSGTRQGFLSNRKIFREDFVEKIKHINTQGFKSHLQGEQRDDGSYSGGHMYNSQATGKTKFGPTFNKKDASDAAISVINKYGQQLGSWTQESNGNYILIAPLNGQLVRIVVQPGGGPRGIPLLKSMYPLKNQNQQGSSGRQG
ncbi:uncharacterized protein [Bemisia tabaci]|uniref:uncharacterized protein n=1 Tax=Bemisia tabaci TaxID=7038 RepID=UPI003B282122